MSLFIPDLLEIEDQSLKKYYMFRMCGSYYELIELIFNYVKYLIHIPGRCSVQLLVCAKFISILIIQPSAPKG